MLIGRALRSGLVTPTARLHCAHSEPKSASQRSERRSVFRSQASTTAAWVGARLSEVSAPWPRGSGAGGKETTIERFMALQEGSRARTVLGDLPAPAET